jgi:hypothetical protein
MNFVRHACTAIYRAAVVLLLLVIASELASTNKFIFAIGSMLFRVIGGSTT